MSRNWEILGVLLITLLIFGCTGGLTTQGNATNPPVSGSNQSPPTVKTYQCPNGINVTNLSNCPHCPSSCDDGNSCTRDYCDASTNFKCIHTAITTCKNDDGCCPTSCNAFNDNDCPKYVFEKTAQGTKFSVLTSNLTTVRSFIWPCDPDCWVSPSNKVIKVCYKSQIQIKNIDSSSHDVDLSFNLVDQSNNQIPEFPTQNNCPSATYRSEGGGRVVTQNPSKEFFVFYDDEGKRINESDVCSYVQEPRSYEILPGNSITTDAIFCGISDDSTYGLTVNIQSENYSETFPFTNSSPSDVDKWCIPGKTFFDTYCYDISCRQVTAIGSMTSAGMRMCEVTYPFGTTENTTFPPWGALKTTAPSYCFVFSYKEYFFNRGTDICLNSNNSLIGEYCIPSDLSICDKCNQTCRFIDNNTVFICGNHGQC